MCIIFAEKSPTLALEPLPLLLRRRGRVLKRVRGKNQSIFHFLSLAITHFLHACLGGIKITLQQSRERRPW